MRPRRRQRGFLLLYVVGLVAAIALLLSQVAQLRSPTPEFVERQMLAAIQAREVRQLVDFVIAGTQAQKLPADSRYLQYRRIVASNPAMLAEIEDQFAVLKSLLESANFHIDVPSSSSAAKGGSTTTSMVLHDGAGVLFDARKEAYRIRLGSTEYKIRVLPGNALPNLNGIDYAGLRRLLESLKLAPGEAAELAANLIDWRDLDDFRTEGLGAERDYYQNLSPAIVPRNGLFRSWQEVAYVKGVTPERLVQLREAMVLGAATPPRLHPEYASADAIAALSGLRPATARAILAEYGKLATDDARADPLDIASGEDASAFDRVTEWQASRNVLRIEVSSALYARTVEYDAKAQRIVSIW